MLDIDGHDFEGNVVRFEACGARLRLGMEGGWDPSAREKTALEHDLELGLDSVPDELVHRYIVHAVVVVEPLGLLDGRDHSRHSQLD